MTDPLPARRPGLGRALRSAFYGGFYRLPVPLRNRLVRLRVRTYVVGAVVLLRDTDDPERLARLRADVRSRCSSPSRWRRRSRAW